jgi:hypothetical protein
MQHEPSRGTEAVLALSNILTKSAQRNRVARYCRRCDEHMQGMCRDESLAFLRAELDKWFERYARFRERVFSPEPIATDATAWDYAETIAILSTRIATLERQQVAA